MLVFGGDGIQQDRILEELSKWWPADSARVIAASIADLFANIDEPDRAANRPQVQSFVDDLISPGERALTQWTPPAKQARRCRAHD
ncbi:hypothetical protein WG922_21155 [Ramlibacter sp. AN1015]|uniref:hypothetical protein n=1 Tax=Ramlibacter sp. AN1015 TaxID=3133428 RepID=UPI0030C16B28